MAGAEIRRYAGAQRGRTGAFVAGQLVGTLSSAANAVLQPIVVLPALVLGLTDSWYLAALPVVLAGVLWAIGAGLGGLSAVRDRPGVWAVAGNLIRLLAVIALAFVVDRHDRSSDGAVLRALFVCFGLYVVGSAIAAQAGTLITGRMVPAAGRTRYFALRTLLGGVAAIAVALVAAALSQGMALGAILQGVVVQGRAYGGGWWDWLTPFSLLVGVSVVAGYALLGATWLIMKTSGPIQDRAYALAWPLAIGTLGAIALVSAATPFLKGAYWERWFAYPGVVAAALVPGAVALTAYGLFRSLVTHRHEYRPFLLSLGLFGLSFVGLGVSIFPEIVPGALTIWQAASPPSSQAFMLVGAAVLIPIIVAYTAYAYWVFRGKVDPAAAYH